MRYLPPPPPWSPPESQQRFIWQSYYGDVQKRGARRLGMIHGSALLLVLVLQSLFASFIYAMQTRWPFLEGNTYWDSLTQMAVAVLMLFPAALLCLRLLNPHEHNRALPFGRPFAALPRGRAALTFGVVGLGMLLCLAGNIAITVLETASNSLGFTLEFPFASDQTPSSPLALTLQFVVIALGPAVIEEIFLRGAIMQPLRRYGDAFAIIVSSLLFALLHGNVLQGVFTFIAGVAMGYAVVLSGSLWPGIVIHFLNNAGSVLLGELFIRYGENENAVALISFCYYGCITVFGAAALVLLLRRRRDLPKLRKPEPLLPTGALTANYLFLNIPMALAMLLYTVEMIYALVLSNISW